MTDSIGLDIVFAMKGVRFARHARRRMKEREVTEDEVEETIGGPDFTRPSVKGRINSYKFLNGRFLRVTHREENDLVSVITVVVRKKPFEE